MAEGRIDILEMCKHPIPLSFRYLLICP
jgi:hypothetical protein